jgi:hypothetical protein
MKWREGKEKASLMSRNSNPRVGDSQFFEPFVLRHSVCVGIPMESQLLFFNIRVLKIPRTGRFVK